MEQDDLTAAVATVNLRHWPNATRARRRRHGDGPGRARARRGPPGQRGVARPLAPYAGPVHGVRRDPAGERPRGVRPAVVVRAFAGGAGAGDRRQAAAGIAHRTCRWACRGAARALPRPGAGAEVRSRLQWVSVAGEAVECAVWWGPLAREGVVRSALVVGARTARPSCASSPANRPRGWRRPAADAVRAGWWLHEPDPAVVAAGLVPRLAAELGAQGLAKGPTLPGHELRRRPRRSRGAIRSRTCCRTSSRRCGPTCATARSVGSRSRSAASRWTRISCAVSCARPATARPRSPWPGSASQQTVLVLRPAAATEPVPTESRFRAR